MHMTSPHSGLEMMATTYSDPLEVLAKIPDSGRLLLLLDLDGTLAHKVKDPTMAFVLPESASALVRFTRSPDISLAFISGREASWIERLVGPAALHPSVVLYGGHGTQKRQGGSTDFEFNHGEKWAPQIQQLAGEVVQSLRSEGSPVKEDPSSPDQGLYVEQKLSSGGLVIHWRSAPQMEQVARQVFEHCLAPLTSIAAPSHILEEGDSILEAKVVGYSKGTAAKEQISAHSPDFIVVAGDDITDLAMMSTVAEQTKADFLIICVGSREVQASLCDKDKFVRVKSPNEVAQILEGICERRSLPPVADFDSLTMSPYFRNHFFGKES